MSWYAAISMDVAPLANDTDQRVVLQGVSWKMYEDLLAWRGERPSPRLAYLEGTLELMTVSREHEELKKRLARLFEAWCDERGVDVDGVGSWTLKNRAARRGAEPDECYVVGRRASDASTPDLAIEVVVTHAGVDKLEIYRKLGVREVWFFDRSGIRFHALRGQRYVPLKRSAVVPRFDVDLVMRHMTSEVSQSAAVRALRAELRR